MESDHAIRALAALAHEHRLAIFRRLVTSGNSGQTAGQLADAIGIAPQSLSFHVKELEHARLVTAEREGRYIRYRLSVAAMRDLLTFLGEDCCGGHPELCGIVPGAAAMNASQGCCGPRPAETRRAPARSPKSRSI